MKQPKTSEKIQIQSRPKKVLTPNDKLTRWVFNLPEHEFADMILDGVDNGITENPKVKSKPKVKTKFRFENVGTVELSSKPLNEFDRAVFDVCVTAQQAGFVGITADTIWRTMTGGRDNAMRVYSSQRAAVLESIDRLMSIRIKIDFSQACDKMKRYCGAGKKLVSIIMPCEYVDGVTVNGRQDCTVIRFLKESALVTIAKAKGQLLNYDAELLNVPNQNNTMSTVTIKSYLVRRVSEIKAHEMTPTVTFADVFKKCGLADADNDRKRKIRKVIRDVLEHLKEHGEIHEFAFEKTNGIYRAVKFNY